MTTQKQKAIFCVAFMLSRLVKEARQIWSIRILYIFWHIDISRFRHFESTSIFGIM